MNRFFDFNYKKINSSQTIIFKTKMNNQTKTLQNLTQNGFLEMKFNQNDLIVTAALPHNGHTTKHSKKVDIKTTKELCHFESTKELYEIMSNPRNYIFDQRQRTITLVWKISAFQFTKDITFQIRLEQEQMSLVQGLELQIIVLRKRLADKQNADHLRMEKFQEQFKEQQQNQDSLKAQNYHKVRNYYKQSIKVDHQQYKLPYKHKDQAFHSSPTNMDNCSKCEQHFIKYSSKQTGQMKSIFERQIDELNMSQIIQKKREKNAKVKLEQFKQYAEHIPQEYQIPQSQQIAYLEQTKIRIPKRQQLHKTKYIKKQKIRQTTKIFKHSLKDKSKKFKRQKEYPPCNYVWTGNKVRLDFDNGDFYFGQIKNYLYHGKGFYYSKQNGTYEGQYKNGLKHGYGVMKDSEHNVYKGTYKKDCKNGEGFEIYSNDEKYVGGFYKDARQGFGTYYFKNGDRYEGQWIDNKYHGKGREIFADGSAYTGVWEEDERNGWGVYQFGNKMIKQEWSKGILKSQEQMQAMENSKEV